jgi:hypothetical protein
MLLADIGGRGVNRLEACIFLLLLGGWWAQATAAPDLIAIGARIYRDGVLPSGLPLHGERPGFSATVGAAAACVNCHRRSGLGVAEGAITAPPITARYLFPSHGEAASSGLASSRSKHRMAYDEATLAGAIRDGVGRGGRELSFLMPRFGLDDPAMAALIAYLLSLPSTPSAGVTDTTIHFATIITPDADPAARSGMLAVLEQFIADKNAFIRGGHKPLRTGERIDFRVTRAWQLHVWQLTGPPETWEAQLQRLLKAEPVFAVLSGLGGGTWTPVHRFCETEALPCLFPNVDAPVVAEQDFYSIYFSKGVLLEAELLAATLADPSQTGHRNVQPRRLVQIFRPGEAGEAAAHALRSLAPAAMERIEWVPDVAGRRSLAQILDATRPTDVLVLWLRPADLAALGSSPPQVAQIFMSGQLGGFEHAALPASWRSAVRMTYPVDLPVQRALRMRYPLAWFKVRNIPVLAERVQADTYLACGVVAQMQSDIFDDFQRDFLIERIESMLSRRQLSGYYPRLSLAPGQRFASKGGYIVTLDADSPVGVRPVSDWIVP